MQLSCPTNTSRPAVVDIGLLELHRGIIASWMLNRSVCYLGLRLFKGIMWGT
jgi:hypothetical protein